MTLSIVDQNKLDAFWSYCVKNQYFNIGYPESADFDYTILERFMRFSINNCGDWGEYCNYLLNSFDFEKEVMEYFARIFKIPFEESWGYVTNGGTEGNMFGCYLGRELFPEGTLYYSKDTHYSVAKIVKLLRIKSSLVESQPNGEMDYDDLIRKIQRDNEEHPIIFANIGTTVRGAIDNIAEIQQRIGQLGIKRDDYYLHADAALSGMILPFVNDPQPFNFADGIDSIGVSGHKMIGSPIPCGIVVAKRKNVDRISVEIDYISAHDKTISGSRNGHTPLMMWEAIRSHSWSDWQRRIEHSLNMAQYAVDRLQAAGIDAWRNKNSITVVFPCPSEAVWKKHCLATSGDIAHLITTAHHLDSSKIDELIDDVIADLNQQAA
ncbi:MULTISPECIES: histidine decarboxylase [Citrobacter]|uniref:Histidine decarboxylase n=1 Tax=Citrobacter pasteurii TaxID=1563222 RepID=A0A6N6K3M1_9ENTR|nr:MULTISPECIES: histidine decarboxylase [Citrobacter]EIQ69282.1 histidine decarboxylase [Shigella flexneri 1235-66]KAA1278069.1 histidine decarboxylase [Citrobacter pasteurii]MBA4713294.1 histidine decarboxylase [Citrobacter pasteurii]MBD0801003.1 histidine decarboxylase [Citrobacter sp. C6_1]MBD0809992.1 histidine decarboxylase [Citrobacter sp. C6_2]